MKYHLKPMRDQIAQEFGVQFGDKTHNRNLTSAQCGQVGGEMVKRTLAQIWPSIAEERGNYATINPASYTRATSNLNQLQ